MAIKFKLKVLLAMNNMTQRDLANKAGIRAPTISAICNGTIKHFPVDVLNSICTTLKCNVYDIIEYTNDNQV